MEMYHIKIRNCDEQVFFFAHIAELQKRRGGCTVTEWNECSTVHYQSRWLNTNPPSWYASVWQRYNAKCWGSVLLENARLLTVETKPTELFETSCLFKAKSISAFTVSQVSCHFDTMRLLRENCGCIFVLLCTVYGLRVKAKRERILSSRKQSQIGLSSRRLACVIFAQDAKH